MMLGSVVFALCCDSCVLLFRRRGLYESVVQLLGEQGDFLDPRINNATVLNNMHHIETLVAKHFDSVHDDDHIRTTSPPPSLPPSSPSSGAQTE